MSERDNCEVCLGTRGGTKGNENVIDGVITCDYCHAHPPRAAPVASASSRKILGSIRVKTLLHMAEMKEQAEMLRKLSYQEPHPDIAKNMRGLAKFMNLKAEGLEHAALEAIRLYDV